jgi:hypothetical protein
LSDAPDIEVYLAGVEPVDIIRLLNEAAGPFVADGTNVDGPQVFARDNITLVIAPDIKDGFVSVWLRGPLRWRSDVEFARFLAAALKCRARCEPGAAYPDVDPHSDVFVEIADGVETLVNWS